MLSSNITNIPEWENKQLVKRETKPFLFATIACYQKKFSIFETELE